MFDLTGGKTERKQEGSEGEGGRKGGKLEPKQVEMYF